jgi:hypothetical protein
MDRRLRADNDDNGKEKDERTRRLMKMDNACLPWALSNRGHWRARSRTLSSPWWDRSSSTWWCRVPAGHRTRREADSSRWAGAAAMGQAVLDDGDDDLRWTTARSTLAMPGVRRGLAAPWLKLPGRLWRRTTGADAGAAAAATMVTGRDGLGRAGEIAAASIGEGEGRGVDADAYADLGRAREEEEQEDCGCGETLRRRWCWRWCCWSWWVSAVPRWRTTSAEAPAPDPHSLHSPGRAARVCLCRAHHRRHRCRPGSVAAGAPSSGNCSP